MQRLNTFNHSRASGLALAPIPAILVLCAVLCMALPARAQDAATGADQYYVHDLIFPDGRRAATIAPMGWVTLDHAELVSPEGLRIVLKSDSASGLSACQWAQMQAQFVDFPSDKTLDVNAHERRVEWTRPRGAQSACLAFVVSGRNSAVIMRAVLAAGGTAYSLDTGRMAWGSQVDAERFRRLEYILNLFSNYFYFEGTAGYRELREAGANGKPLDAAVAPPAPDNSGPGQSGDTTPDTGPLTDNGSTPDTPAATAPQPLPDPADYEIRNGSGTYPRDADMERAKRLVRKGRYDEAEAIFRGLMAKAPYDARSGLGDIAVAKGDYQAAVEEFQAAILLNPRAPDAYNGLGKIAFNKGDYDKARQYFNQALESDPSDTVSMTNLGWVQLAQGDVPGAQEWYQKALEAGPSPAAATGLYTGLTQVALARGEPAQALNYISELQRADPDNAVAQAALAQANLLLNDPELALKAARRAIDRDPGRHEFQYIAGESAAAGGLYADAAAYYEKAIELAGSAPQAPAYYLALARAHSAAGARDAARATLERASKAFPDNPDIASALQTLDSGGAEPPAPNSLNAPGANQGESPNTGLNTNTE
jgi:tetratricopeptide (TPR) repeat protein